MIGTQDHVIAFLSTPGAYGLPLGTPIPRIDTHISVVWLAGAHAYKLKRAVAFDYVDFSTTTLRRDACEAELRLNRRTAPSLYLGVRAVTRQDDGALELGGTGEPVDFVVEMQRFDQEMLFDRLAEVHQLDVELMDGVADAIARLHRAATVRRDRGGRDGMSWVVEGNARAFEGMSPDLPERSVADRVIALSRAALLRHGALLDARREDGHVRECHGDLHLRNICLLDGVPTLFDGVEFNEDVSCVDLLYDLAFLLMDLWHRDLRAHANRVLNSYMTRMPDLEGLLLLPLFLSCRASIRAKTTTTTAGVQSDPGRTTELMAEAHAYLALAGQLLCPPAPCLIGIGGFSGSGKSTLARRLAAGVGAAPGALVLRSDVIRKQILGVSETTRLGSEAYSADMTRRVYRTLAERAASTLAAGHAVIVDAVFSDAEERRAIAAVARSSGVPMVGLWLDAPSELLVNRVAARVGDASDATPAVVQRQLESGTGALQWRRVDASVDIDLLQRQVEALLKEALH